MSEVNPSFLLAREETARRIKNEFGSMVEVLPGRSRFYPCPGWEDLIRRTLIAMGDASSGMRIEKLRNKMGECDIFPDWKTVGKDSCNRVFQLYGAARQESRGICLWCGSRDDVSTSRDNTHVVTTLCDICRTKFIQDKK